MAFIDNLKRIAKSKGKTVTAICKDLGLSTSKSSSWINGNIPKEKYLIQLADYLDCKVMDFFNDEPSTILSDDELDIIKIYRSLDRQTKHKFMAMVYDYEEKE